MLRMIRPAWTTERAGSSGYSSTVEWICAVELFLAAVGMMIRRGR